jgi:hypothetical protein
MTVQGAHDRPKIVTGKDDEVWTMDEPIEVHLRGNIEKVLRVYSTRTRHTNRPQEN